MRNVIVKLVIGIATAAAITATQRAAEGIWRDRTGREPPSTKNPFSRESSWRDVVVWTAALGVSLAAVRAGVRKTGDRLLHPSEAT